MGLLTQGIAGAVAGGAGAAYKMLDDRYKANLIAERDAAQSAREENLARLRMSLADEYEQGKEQRKQSYEEGQIDPDILLDGQRTTVGSAKKAVASKSLLESADPENALATAPAVSSRKDEAEKTKRYEQYQDRLSLIEAQAAESRITREEADKREAALRKELKAMDGATRKELASIAGGKSGGTGDDKPLTADKAMERGTMLMRAARNTDGQITDQYMYDEGKKLIKWAQTKAKGGIPEDAPVPEGSFDSSVIYGGAKSTTDIGGLIGTGAAQPQAPAGPRKEKAIDKSMPVKKNGVLGYRQPDGRVLSATGKRLN